MENERLTKRVFTWAKRLAFNSSVKNWVFRVNCFMSSIGMQHICLVNEHLHQEVLLDVDTVLSEYYEQIWRTAVNRVGAVRGNGRNKLRTYRLFKSDIGSEQYVNIRNRHHRSALAKFRSGTAPIAIELGRHNGVQYHNRLCTLCKSNNIEDELHILVHCNFYEDIREDLYNDCEQIDHNFRNLSNVDQLCFILGNAAIASKAARACYFILQRRHSFVYM